MAFKILQGRSPPSSAGKVDPSHPVVTRQAIIAVEQRLEPTYFPHVCSCFTRDDSVMHMSFNFFGFFFGISHNRPGCYLSASFKSAEKGR